MDEPTRKIADAVDCCRPGRDDLRAPEMAFLARALEADDQLRARYERTQDFDAHVGRAYHDVAVPEGLADRLVARLARHAAGDPDGRAADEEPSGLNAVVDAAAREPIASPCDSDPIVAGTARRAAIAERRSRRYLVFVGVPAVALVAILAGLLIGLRSPEPVVTCDELLRSTDAAVDAALQAAAWNHDLAAVPADREFPSQTVQSEPLGWQTLTMEAMDPRAVAFVMSYQTDAEVILLVSRSPRQVAGLRQEPTKLPASGQQTVGAWQQDDHVYVLVVRGRGHDRRFGAMLRARGQMA